jgi:hypothetical protein
MLEGRLEEIASDLDSLYAQVAMLKKEKLLPSPGLKDAIMNLEQKKENFKDGIKFWKDLRKVYPGYNR